MIEAPLPCGLHCQWLRNNLFEYTKIVLVCPRCWFHPTLVLIFYIYCCTIAWCPIHQHCSKQEISDLLGMEKHQFVRWRLTMAYLTSLFFVSWLTASIHGETTWTLLLLFPPKKTSLSIRHRLADHLNQGANT